MKTYILPSIRITLIMLLLCGVVYFGVVTIVGRLVPGAGKGNTVTAHGRVVGYQLLGQSFTQDRYFQGRPSAVSYNAAGSGGSNKGPSNKDYLATVQERMDSFLAHNPGVTKEQVPAELVTASGSGLDPDISPEAAKIQVMRIARQRGIAPEKLYQLIASQTRSPWFAPDHVNVLSLNVSLDNIK